jgi:hypothetical protein
LVFALDSPDGGTGCVLARSGSFNNEYQCSGYAADFASDPGVTNLVNGPVVAPMLCNLQGYRCTNPCPAPGVYDSATKKCSPSAETGCDGQEQVYDPVTGTMVCAGSGDSSSSASSNACVVPGDFDGDCVPDDQQNSSANSSAPTSAPSSSPSSSGGDDDGGDDGGNNNGGGGNNNGGNNSGGGGSASSSASSGSNSSWTPHAGYGNWIPVDANSTCPNKYQDQSGQWWCAGGNSNQFGSASSGAASSYSGECDPTSKSYFHCVTSLKMDGTQASDGWTPISGYGNWLPVNENSPCVNKYQDASGQWWCAAPSNNGSGTGSSSGTGTSSGSGSSAAGQCDSTSKDYLQCISTGNGSSAGSAASASSASSGASTSSSGTFSSLGEKGEFDGEASEKKHEELVEELEQKIADIKEDIAGQFGGQVTGTGTIQDFCKNIRGNEVCFGMKKFEAYLEPISAAIFLVACVIAFAIVLRG